MQEEKRTDTRKEEKGLPRKPYEPPEVILSAHLDDLWATMGPMRACTFSGSVVACQPDWDPLDPFAPPPP